MTTAPHHQPRKRFGQNFLHDPVIIQRIVDTINPKPGDAVIEIGPGQGALTRLLIERVDQLHVIEIDRDLANTLASTLGHPSNLTIHNMDALRFEFSETGNSGLRIIGNLPYNISTPLLFHILSYSDCIHDLVFMLQKEVVERIVAKPHTKQYGRLSVMLQLYCDIQSLFTIKPGAFKPVPRVDSALIRLKPRHIDRYALKNNASFSKIVKLAFNQRRKTIRNSLAQILSEADIAGAGIDPSCRAEELAVSDFVELANCQQDL